MQKQQIFEDLITTLAAHPNFILHTKHGTARRYQSLQTTPQVVEHTTKHQKCYRQSIQTSAYCMSSQSTVSSAQAPNPENRHENLWHSHFIQFLHPSHSSHFLSHHTCDTLKDCSGYTGLGRKAILYEDCIQR
jgi:hypothetical protein